MDGRVEACSCAFACERKPGQSAILAAAMRILISRSGFLLVGIAVALLGGCATSPAPVVDRSLTGATANRTSGTSVRAASEHANGRMTGQGYVVARGDTLYSIAFRHGVDFRALAQRNGIGPPYVIRPGQVLKIDAVSPADGSRRVGIAQASTSSREPQSQNNAPMFETLPSVPAPVTNTLAPPTSPPVAGTMRTLPSGSASPASTASTLPTVVAGSPPTGSPPSGSVATAPPLAIVSGKTRSVDGITWQWPADGAVISGFQSGVGSGAGLDIAGAAGDPVRAAADGVVVYSGNGLIGYGELIIIKHSDNYLSAYGHNRKRLVQEGEHVRAGQLIAQMGSSGAPREELHFEIRKNGKPVDPTAYLPGR